MIQLTHRSALLFLALVATTTTSVPTLAQSDSLLPTDLKSFATPYKYGCLILQRSANPGDFDSGGVDSAFVFSVNGLLYMTYVGFDGVGYQTGLAESTDLVHWRKRGVIVSRDPDSPYTRYNVGITSLLRDNRLGSEGAALQISGEYVASWNAYPKPGYEGGAGIIGLAWSSDLTHWRLGAPILWPEGGELWERGGLYKSYLVAEGGIFYLFYNAKDRTDMPWHEQTGVAVSPDLKHWTRSPHNPIIRNGKSGSFDERFASDPAAFRIGTRWAVYYFGLSEDFHARELLAIGLDPAHLVKAPQPMIDIGAPGSIDDRFAHKPALITWHGDLYHFYTAASGAGFGAARDVRGITVARSRSWSTSLSGGITCNR
jgi:predicted GH43/DUF377 family glycosyl hydrolase